MTVTRDVILDLLPLYLAGEASPGTRVLVSEYLAQDPELAEQVRRQQSGQPAGEPSNPAPDLEMRTLLKTRRAISLRAWMFGLAWFFTATSFGVNVGIDSGGVTHVRFAMIDYPWLFGASLIVAAVCWIAWAVLRKRTSVR